MNEREHLDNDRKRSMAFEALAHPVRDDQPEVIEDVRPSAVEIHDGEVFDDSPPDEDILEGLDRQGLDPRLERRSP